MANTPFFLIFHEVVVFGRIGIEALLEDFDLLAHFDDFVLFFLFLLFSEAIDSSGALDGLETDIGLGDLTLLLTALSELSSDFLDSTQ